jgi:hypothetical protein
MIELLECAGRTQFALLLLAVLYVLACVAGLYRR